jgi:DNA-binding NarL/FixJ family response regulator
VGLRAGWRAVKPARILVADDHELVRQGLRALLESEPQWTVCGEAATGREALVLALDLKPDVLILDLALPELNGLEVIRQVRRTLPTRILVVTMHGSDDIAREAIDAGANGYVLKSDAGRTLSEAVRTVLSDGQFVSPRLHLATGEPSPSRQPSGRASPLTAREREVLQLLAEGQANKDIAAALGISRKTAETHRARIMAKLEIHSIADLVRYAVRNRIIEP